MFSIFKQAMCQPTNKMQNMHEIELCEITTSNEIRIAVERVRLRLHPDMNNHPLSKYMNVIFDLHHGDALSPEDLQFIDSVLSDRWEQLLAAYNARRYVILPPRKRLTAGILKRKPRKKIKSAKQINLVSLYCKEVISF